MAEKPSISIAIPIFNSEKFLRKCLDSVIVQTYENLEIVALNNGSTDSSLQIIEEYAAKDSRIKYYTIPHVPTETWSRNNAYIRTTSEWVIPLDSDDFLEPEYVEKLWTRHVETGAEWVGATMARVNPEGVIDRQIPKADFDYAQVMPGKEAVIFTLRKWLINANGALIHRNLIPCIETGETEPLFNVEYDTRVILYKAAKVAFVDAKYCFGYNPNSFGRKASYNGITYPLHAFMGLLPFIQEHYDKESEEVKEVTETSASILLHSFRVYTAYKKQFSEEQKKKYHSMINSLYHSMDYSCLRGGLFKKLWTRVAVSLNVFMINLIK